jgi:hypothetical protein
MEAKLSITKRSSKLEDPDNGFQQGGLIVRSAAGSGENYFICSLGTGGSDASKFFLKRTTAGKTKVQVEKAAGLTGWLQIEKKGKSISVYQRQNEHAGWIKSADYDFDWLKMDLQVGFAIMARFAGNGPKQRPDMQCTFSNIRIEKL